MGGTVWERRRWIAPPAAQLQIAAEIRIRSEFLSLAVVMKASALLLICTFLNKNLLEFH